MLQNRLPLTPYLADRTKVSDLIYFLTSDLRVKRSISAILLFLCLLPILQHIHCMMFASVLSVILGVQIVHDSSYDTHTYISNDELRIKQNSFLVCVSDYNYDEK
jgi:hypothetical protein